APSVKRAYGLLESIASGALLEPISAGIQNSSRMKNLEEFEIQIEEFFRIFSSSTGLNIQYHKHLSKDFVAFLIDTETIFENIRIPNSMLALVNPHGEISPEIRERLRNLLVNKTLSAETQIVILILFSKTSALDKARRL